MRDRCPFGASASHEHLIHPCDGSTTYRLMGRVSHPSLPPTTASRAHSDVLDVLNGFLNYKQHPWPLSLPDPTASVSMQRGFFFKSGMCSFYSPAYLSETGSLLGPAPLSPCNRPSPHVPNLSLPNRVGNNPKSPNGEDPWDLSDGKPLSHFFLNTRTNSR
jgi:hypothetical protein